MIPSSFPGATRLPFGSWPSSISFAVLLSGANKLAALLPGIEGLWWTESRPAEQGRTALCWRTYADLLSEAGMLSSGVGDPHERADPTLLPAPWNVRNRVHEYGGGSLATDGTRLWFCNDADAGIYQLDASTPVLLRAEPGCRYADLCWWPEARLLLAVCEDHRASAHRAGGATPAEAVNYVVAIDVEGPARGQQRTLVDGHDFFSNPCPSPDGTTLAWLSWDHPDMPWDGTTLWCASWTNGSLSVPVAVAGGRGESLFQPTWSPDGALHIVSDRTGWWNLYRLASTPGGPAIPLCPMEAEFATPQWEFGMRSFAFLADGGLVAIARSDGVAQLGRIPAGGGAFAPLPLHWQDFRGLHVQGKHAWCIAGSPTEMETLLRIDLATGEALTLGPPGPTYPADAFSVPRAIRYPGSGGVTTHAFFYRPHHPDYAGPDDARPPLIVINHGGPTSATSSTLRLAVQFWTSRGFAVLDVNYGGSTGHGRPYRLRLNGQWGVVDVEDAVAGVHWLAELGEIDPERAAIRGSSAGGFTTLAALAFHDVFRAGVSLYGIGDLSLLAQDTHKFESRYMDGLVAPWPAGRELYAARSPLLHLDGFSSALLLLQGEEDKVVPPNQAKAMFEAVAARGFPVALLMFPGEQHGFRRAETVRCALAAELYFYGRVFGFVPADELEPIAIRNLEDA